VTRHALDAYMTASWQVDALVDNLPELGGVILCPCAGDGSIIRRLQQHGVGTRFVTNDINPGAGADFALDSTLASSWRAMIEATSVGDRGRPDWIVENPPFNAAIEILKHAHEAARVGVVFMSRVSFAEPTKDRGPWLAAHPYAKRITLERYSFTGNGKSDSATTDWLVWVKPGVVLAPPFGVSAYGYRP